MTLIPIIKIDIHNDAIRVDNAAINSIVKKKLNI